MADLPSFAGRKSGFRNFTTLTMKASISNIPTRFFGRRRMAWLALLLLFLLHLPFLSKDPDKQVDIHTRGAWTDEGLYASQILNFLETGTLDLHENSTLVRGPLFNLAQLPVFLISGPSRAAARLLVLLSLLAASFLLFRKQPFRAALWIFTAVLLLQYQVFHFSHYAMAEMMIVATILMALHFYTRAVSGEAKVVSQLLWASFFLFAAYGLKIQYLYAAGILPLALAFDWLQALFQRRDAQAGFRLFWIGSTFSLAWAGLYFLAWYLPNADFYTYIMGSEVNGRYPEGLAGMWTLVRFNIEHLVWTPATRLLLLGFIASLFFLMAAAIGKPGIFREKYRHPWWPFLLAWLMLELHKLPMNYLPNRYLLSLFVLAGLFSALLGARLWHKGGIVSRSIVLLLSGLLLGINMHYYMRSLHSRSEELTVVNEYLRQQDLRGKVVLGSWAPALCWGTRAVTKPVWKDYFNDEDPIRRFAPAMIISETDEEDSNEAYRSQGIHLDSLATENAEFAVWRYRIGLYALEAEISDQ